MRMTSNQIKELPNGTKLKIFLSGSGWEEEFGKVYNVIKVNDNELREIGDNWWEINDIDVKDQFSLEAACYIETEKELL